MQQEISQLEAVRRAREELAGATAQKLTAHIEQSFGLHRAGDRGRAAGHASGARGATW